MGVTHCRMCCRETEAVLGYRGTEKMMIQPRVVVIDPEASVTWLHPKFPYIKTLKDNSCP